MRRALLAAPLAILAGPAAALPVTIAFTGTVTEVAGRYADFAALGDAVIGAIRYDTALAPLDSDPSPTRGLFEAPPFAWLTGSLTINGTTIVATTDGADKLGTTAAEAGLPTILSASIGGASFGDALSLAIASVLDAFLGSAALPSAIDFIADPEDIPSSGQFFNATLPHPDVMVFDIASATTVPVAVPEPAGLGAMLLASLALFRKRRVEADTTAP